MLRVRKVRLLFPWAKVDHTPATKANLCGGEKGSRIQNALYPDCKTEDFIKALSNPSKKHRDAEKPLPIQKEGRKYDA